MKNTLATSSCGLSCRAGQRQAAAGPSLDPITRTCMSGGFSGWSLPTLFLLAAACALLASCASVLTGQGYDQRVLAPEPTAFVWESDDGRRVEGTTPASFHVKDVPLSATVTWADGKVTKLKRDAKGATWGNVFFPIIGLVGLGLDYGSGAAWRLPDADRTPGVNEYEFEGQGVQEMKPDARMSKAKRARLAEGS